MYWGDFKAGMAKIKVALGTFDGGSARREYRAHLGQPRPD